MPKGSQKIDILGSGVVTFNLHSFSVNGTPTPLFPSIPVLRLGTITYRADGLFLSAGLHYGNALYSVAITASIEKNAPTGRLSVVATPINGNPIILGTANGFFEGTVIVVNTGQHSLEDNTFISIIADGQIPDGAIGAVTLAADVISGPGPDDNKIKKDGNRHKMK